jgi:hypothetical protein
MSSSRPFAYNPIPPNSAISGTLQVGNLAVGVDTNLNYTGNAGGVQWWMGPDEELGYVITQSVPSLNQPNPLGISAGVGFFRSEFLTESSFISISNLISGQSFASGDEASTWLTSNGYWNSWSPDVSPSPTITPTITPTPTPTPVPLVFIQSGIEGTVFELSTCSGAVSAIALSENITAVDATPGITSQPITLPFGDSWGIRFKLTGSHTNWNAGTYTVRLNVVTANMNVTLSSVYVCRVASDDTPISTIGSSTALGLSLATTGVITTTVSGTAETPNFGDYINIVLVFTNGAMTNQTFEYLPDQNIDTPLT